MLSLGKNGYLYSCFPENIARKKVWNDTQETSNSGWAERSHGIVRQGQGGEFLMNDLLFFLVFQPRKLLLFKKLNRFFKNKEKVHHWYCYTNKHAGQLERTTGRPWSVAGWDSAGEGERLAEAEAAAAH